LRFQKAPLIRLYQALCLYAAITESPTLVCSRFQAFGSEGMGLAELACRRNSTITGSLYAARSSVFVTAFN
jgi:hypothetical protein